MVWSWPGRRPALALAGLIGVAVLVAGCGRPGGPAARTGQLLVGRTERLPSSTMPPSQITAAEDAFGRALFHRVCSPAPQANVLLSPESAAEALGMLYAGANGPTAAAVGRLLHLPAWRPGLVAALDRHTAMLAGLRQLTVTNHLFEQSGIRPTQRVLNDLRTAYRAGLWTVNFGAEPATTNQINAVVGQETHGLVRPSSRRRCPPQRGLCCPTPFTSRRAGSSRSRRPTRPRSTPLAGALSRCR